MAAYHPPTGKMMTIRSYKLRLSLALLLAAPLMLNACSSEQHGDLKAYVDKVKAREGSGIEPLPEIKPYETFVYIDEDRRDPFTQYIEEVRKDVPADSGLRPDITRKREALEEFPLDSLKYGEILEITETEVKLKEIIPNGATGGWVDRIASLSLSE
jgi:type IV pilus assembly protein PilP